MTADNGTEEDGRRAARSEMLRGGEWLTLTELAARRGDTDVGLTGSWAHAQLPGDHPQPQAAAHRRDQPGADPQPGSRRQERRRLERDLPQRLAARPDRRRAQRPADGLAVEHLGTMPDGAIAEVAAQLTGMVDVADNVYYAERAQLLTRAAAAARQAAGA